MHIAVLTAPNALKDEKQTISKLPAILQRLGVTPIIISDSLIDGGISPLLPTGQTGNKDGENILPPFRHAWSNDKKGGECSPSSFPSFFLSDSFQAVIIEEYAHPRDTGYLTAFALMKKKPLLYLISKYKLPAQASYVEYLKYVHGHGEKRVYVRYYDVLSLQRLISDFVERVQKDPRVDPPRVKFTLRLTEKLEEYLTWKSGRSHKSKAKVIRSAIDGLMEEDKHYPANRENPEGEKPMIDPL